MQAVGRPVEKDYAELCNLLNVQAYPHLSKIRSTMGLALSELVQIKYISKWDVQRDVDEEGIQDCFDAGRRVTANSADPSCGCAGGKWCCRSHGFGKGRTGGGSSALSREDGRDASEGEATGRAVWGGCGNGHGGLSW